MIRDLPNLGAPVRERVGPALNAEKKNADVSEKSTGKETSPNDAFAKVLEKKADWPRKMEPEMRSEIRPEPSVKLSPKTPQDNERSAQAEETENGEDQLQAPVQNPVQRQTAILKFMDSMESEFGVPPERIVEAMANLKQADQLKNPEDTAKQVIDKLELEDGDRERALALYLGLLTKLSAPAEIAPAAAPALASSAETPLAATSGSELMKGNPAVSGAENPLNAKERRALLNDSLDRMANRFFMNDRQGPQAAGKEAYGMLERPAGMEKAAPEISPDTYQALGKNQFLPENKVKEGDGKVDPRLAALLTPVAATPVKAPDQSVLMAQSQNPATVSAEAPAVNAELMPGLQALQPKADAGNHAMNGAKAAAAGGEAAKGGSLLGAMAAGIAGAAAKGKAGHESESSSTSEDESGDAGSADIPAGRGDDVQFFPQQPRDKEVNTFAGLMAAGKVAGGEKTSATEANIEKLVGQARIVAKNGGGEAIVKLNPEGLGEVKLKIAVKDGRVQVDMATESAEAKKMLESTVGDLKHALNSHKLSVDSIKVDVGNQASADRNSQNGGGGSGAQDQSMNFRQDPGREQARQFFANLREENMARREPFLEAGAVRDYQRPITRIGESKASPASRYAGAGRGEKMNIVA